MGTLYKGAIKPKTIYIGKNKIIKIYYREEIIFPPIIYDDDGSLIFTYNITENNTLIKLPICNDPNNIKTINVQIDWGDKTQFELYTSEFPEHIYEKAGQYKIKLLGTIPCINSSIYPQNTKELIKINNWGDNNLGITKIVNGFTDTNLEYVANDEFGALRNITDITNLFKNTRINNIPNIFKYNNISIFNNSFENTDLVIINDKYLERIVPINTNNMISNIDSLLEILDVIDCSKITSDNIITNCPNLTILYLKNICNATNIINLSNLNLNNESLIYIFNNAYNRTNETDKGIINIDFILNKILLTEDTHSLYQATIDCIYKNYEINGLEFEINTIYSKWILSGYAKWNNNKDGILFNNIDIVTIPSVVDGDKLAKMDNMFKDVTFSNIEYFNTINVKHTVWSFANTIINNIDKKLDLSIFNFNNVTYSNYMFQNSDVKYIDISNWNTYNLISARGMFIRCLNLESIIGTLDLINCTEDYSLYEILVGCRNLKQIYIKNLSDHLIIQTILRLNEESIIYLFDNAITFTEHYKTIRFNISSEYFMYDNNNNYTELYISYLNCLHKFWTIEYLTFINNGTKYIQELWIDSNLARWNVENESLQFYSYSIIDIPDVTDAEKLTNCDMTFAEVKISNLGKFNTINVKSMRGMFALTEFPDTVVDLSWLLFINCTTTEYMFELNRLSILYLNCTVNKITNANYMFKNCSNLIKIEGIIDLRYCTNNLLLVQNCTKLEHIYIRNLNSSINLTNTKIDIDSITYILNNVNLLSEVGNYIDFPYKYLSIEDNQECYNAYNNAINKNWEVLGLEFY